MPAFIRTLTFSQLMHLLGLGAIVALTATGTLTETVGLPIITGLVGLGVNADAANPIPPSPGPSSGS